MLGGNEGLKRRGGVSWWPLGGEVVEGWARL